MPYGNRYNKLVTRTLMGAVLLSMMMPNASALAPSGQYLDWANRHIMQYDNGTGMVTDTNMVLASTNYRCNANDPYPYPTDNTVRYLACGDCSNGGGENYVITWGQPGGVWTGTGICMHLEGRTSGTLAYRTDVRVYTSTPSTTFIRAQVVTRLTWCGSTTGGCGVSTGNTEIFRDECLPGDATGVFACNPGGPGHYDLAGNAPTWAHAAAVRTVVVGCNQSPCPDVFEDNAANQLAIGYIVTAAW